MSLNLESLPGKLEAWAGSYEWINKSAEFLSSHTGIHFSPFHAFEVDAAVFTLVTHLLIYLYLFLTRAGTRNSNIATGRFLTKKEFKVNYFIPNRIQFYLPRYLMIFVIFPVMGVIFLPTLIEVIFPRLYSYANVLGLFLLAGTTYPSFSFLINRNYLDYRASAEGTMKLFLLGKLDGKKVGLVGGQYRNALGILYRKEQRQTHVLIVGPTGSGKTSAFLIPGLIEDAKSGDSCFVIDVKPDEDLVDIVGPFWNKEGKKVILFDVWKREKEIGILADKIYNEPIPNNPEKRKGVLVYSIKESSTAKIAGIFPGDILTRLNDIELEGHEHLTDLLESFNPGDSFKFDLIRNKDIKEIKGKVKEGLHFNPLANLKPDLDNMRTFATVKTIVDTIYRVNEEETGKVSADASYHKKLEKRLVEDLMFAALFQPVEKKNLFTVAEVLGGTIENVTDFILSAVRMDGSADLKTSTRFHKEVAWFLDESDSDLKRRKPNMIAGAQEKLALFRAPNVKNHLIRPELDLDMIFKEPCLFIVKAPMDKETEQGYLLASMFARLVIVKVAQSSQERKLRKHNIWLYLDEFPNLKIPNITSTIATIRSSSAGVIAAVQDQADLFTSTKATNTTNSPQSLLTNFGMTVLFAGCSTETCEKVAKSFGDKIVIEKSKIQDVFALIDFRSMKRWSKAPLVTADGLRYMDKNDVMIAPNQFRPFKIRTEPYFKNKAILKTIKDSKDVVLWIPDMSAAQLEQYNPVEKKAVELTTTERNLISPPSEDEPDIRDSPVNSSQSDEPSQQEKDFKIFGDSILPMTENEHHHGKDSRDI